MSSTGASSVRGAANAGNAGSEAIANSSLNQAKKARSLIADCNESPSELIRNALQILHTGGLLRPRGTSDNDYQLYSVPAVGSIDRLLATAVERLEIAEALEDSRFGPAPRPLSIEALDTRREVQRVLEELRPLQLQELARPTLDGLLSPVGPGVRYELTDAGAEVLAVYRGYFLETGQWVPARRPQCIYCGCTDRRACSIESVQLTGNDRQAVQLYYEDNGEQLPDRVPCWWISETPAVCSNPHCAELHRARGQVTV